MVYSHNIKQLEIDNEDNFPLSDLTIMTASDLT